MTRARLEFCGEVYLALDAVASWYRVDAELLGSICALGLLESVERVEDTLAVAAAELDRLAEILRLHLHLGMDLDTVSLLVHGAWKE
jgi:hypothetical protein